MTQVQTVAGRRNGLYGQASRHVLLSALGAVAMASSTLLAPGLAVAADIATTNTTAPTNPPNDRQRLEITGAPVAATVAAGDTVTGNGLAVSNFGTGGVVVINNGAITVDAGATPTAGGVGALNINAAGGTVFYSGGDVINNGVGSGLEVRQTGAGSITVQATGSIVATTGEGVVIRDGAAGTGIDVTVNSVTALAIGQDAVDIQSGSLAGDLTLVVSGNLVAGNSGVVAANVQAGSTGDIFVTTNGAIDARFGIDAEHFGLGNVTVSAVGPVTVTTGVGVFGRTGGGDLSLTTAGVTSTGNTAIAASQTGAGAGVIAVTTNGAVSGTIGISATNSGSGSVSITTNATVTGAVAEGLVATGNGAVTVQVADVITGATNGATINGVGAVSVTGAGGFVGQNGDALTVTNTGAGETLVNISGDVVATNGSGINVRDSGLGTGMSVTTGNVTALSAGENGVSALSLSLTGDLTVVTNGDVAASNGGIVAALISGAAVGDVSVTSNGAASGRFGIDAENQGSGSVTVTAVGPVTGTTGAGVFAQSTGGDITVTTGLVTASGSTAILAFQTAAGGTGDISITTNDEVSGTFGIQAINSGSGATTVSTGGTVTGALAVGIDLTGNGAMTLQVADVVTGAVDGAIVNGSGAISVTGSGGFVGQSGNGLTIQNNGAAATLVNISGAVSATFGDGIVVRDVAAGTGVSVTTGSVTALTAARDGIDVQSLSLTGDVTIVANGAVTGASAGIRAALTDATSTGDISVTANGAIGGGTGISAQTAGSGAVSVAAVGPVTTTSSGVVVQTQGGDITVNASAIDAGFIGVSAQQNNVAGAGDISVTTGGPVTGTRGIQIANAGSGDITVVSAGTVTATGGFGLSTIGNGDVTVQVADTVTGTFGGMQLSAGGDINITGAGGFVGGGTAMFIRSLGAGETNINLAGPIVSSTGKGLVILDELPGADINVTTGAITAIGPGVNTGGIDIGAFSLTGDVTVVTNGPVNTTGAGISAELQQNAAVGNVSVTSNGAINGRAGISAGNAGSGSITVTAIGPIVATDRGILATARRGDATITAGSISAVSTAIETRQIAAAGSGDLSVTVNGAISAATGISALNLGSGDVFLVGAAGSSISGSTNSVSATLTGGAFSLANAGTINGRLTVTGSNVATSRVTNSATGVMNVGSGASGISGGLTNAGIVNIGSGGSLSFLGSTINSGRINLAGAGSFTTNGTMSNSGVISALNGVVGNVVTVGGNYSGGGQLLLDYSTATATADRLLIGGSATGTTNVQLNRVGPRTLVAGGFLPMVTTGSPASANAFTSNTALFSPGFILDSFGQNPVDARQFGLIQSINPDTVSLASLSFVGEAASQLLNEPVAPHVLTANAGDQRLNFWIRGGSGSTTQTLRGSVAGGGLAFTAEGDVETEQQVLQVGADYRVLQTGDWSVHLGLTGGVFDGDTRSLGADHVAVDGQFIGGYVVVDNGAFTVDAALRKEWRAFNLYLPTLLGPTGDHDLDGEAIVASVRAGWRVGGEAGWSATPFVSYDYADASIDNLQVDPSTIYRPGGKTTQIGELGVKVAYRTTAGPLALEPFASVSAMKNWSSDERSTYLFNAPATTFVQDVEGWEDAVRYSIGVTGGTADGRVGGFLVGTVNDGSQLEGYSVTAGFKVSF